MEHYIFGFRCANSLFHLHFVIQFVGAVGNLCYFVSSYIVDSSISVILSERNNCLSFDALLFFSSVLTKPRLPLIPRCMSRHWRNLFLLCLICCVATHFRCIHGVRIDVVVVVVNILLKKLTRELLCA